MGKYKPYPEYKDSGVEWLGDVPEGWSVTRNIGLFSERNEKNFPHEELLAVTIAHGVLPQKKLAQLTDRKNTASEDKTNYKLVKVDDIAYNKMRMWQGAIGVSSHQGIVSPAYVILQPKQNVHSRFFYYQFKTPAFIKEAGRFSYGLCDDMNSLRYDDFRTIYSVVPFLKEQIQITAFLDHETAKIDRLIEKQEKLIELLKEKRQAVISHAVALPTDSHAPIKFYVEILPGYAFPSAEYSAKKDGVKLLRGVNVGVENLKWDELETWPEEDLTAYLDYELKVGDLVIGMDRPWIKEGIRVAFVQQSDLPALLLQRVARMRAVDALRQSYLYLLLKSEEFKAHVFADLTGVSVPHLSADQIGSFVFKLPTLEEQDKRLENVQRQFNMIDSCVAKAKSSIKLLKERRTALISAAVTGKIDVRDWQKD